jgi:glycosyltransferase involved in cell wall biosynthesis
VNRLRDEPSGSLVRGSAQRHRTPSLQEPVCVSVIIPTYNRARILRAAIESVLAQTYSHTEVVVVDDGSTDETGSMLRQYEGKIHVIRQANAGPAAARNTGVRNSNGDLLAFLDSDDVWTPRKLELQVDAMARAGQSVQCCICDVRIQRPGYDGVSSFERAGLQPSHACGIWLNPFEVVATRFFFFNQAALIRRAAFEQVNGYDEQLRFLEDTDLALRVALLSPWAFVAEPLVVWQQSADSLSVSAASRKIQMKQSEFAIRSRLCLGDPRLQRHNRRKKLIEKEARRNQREIRADLLSQGKNPWMRALGSALGKIERYRLALFRRSLWYPDMRVASFAHFQALKARTRSN